MRNCEISRRQALLDIVIYSSFSSFGYVAFALMGEGEKRDWALIIFTFFTAHFLLFALKRSVAIRHVCEITYRFFRFVFLLTLVNLLYWYIFWLSLSYYFDQYGLAVALLSLSVLVTPTLAYVLSRNHRFATYFERREAPGVLLIVASVAVLVGAIFIKVDDFYTVATCPAEGSEATDIRVLWSDWFCLSERQPLNFNSWIPFVLFLCALLPLAGNTLIKQAFSNIPKRNRKIGDQVITTDDLTLCYSFPLFVVGLCTLFFQRLLDDGAIYVDDLPSIFRLCWDEARLIFMALFGFCFPVMYTNACLSKGMDVATLDYGSAIRPLEIFLFLFIAGKILPISDSDPSAGPADLYYVGMGVCIIAFICLFIRRSRKPYGFCDESSLKETTNGTV